MEFKMSKITTIQKFKERVQQLASISMAYYVFECQCTETLRAEIYAQAPAQHVEPFRSAMHAMGFCDY